MENLLQKKPKTNINFTVRRELHAKLSYILKLQDKHMRDVMTELVEQYVLKNEVPAAQPTESCFFGEDCEACQ